VLADLVDLGVFSGAISRFLLQSFCFVIPPAVEEHFVKAKRIFAAIGARAVSSKMTFWYKKKQHL